jgi:proteasome lid subunit RPN8/RPN11
MDEPEIIEPQIPAQTPAQAVPALFGPPLFGWAVELAAQEHARAQYPRESCGFVIGDAYVPLENRHPEPEKSFRIANADWPTDRATVQAIIHSHPNGPAWPSGGDMQQQIATDIPWGIVPTDGVGCLDTVWWGDFVLDLPLIERSFVHGVTDCLGLIRAWFWQERQILIPDYPRSYEWWLNGQNMYLDHFDDAGFFEVDRDEARPGDVALIRYKSEVPNHGGIVLPRGLVLHHLDRRLSRREPLGPWLRKVTHFLRHKQDADGGI